MPETPANAFPLHGRVALVTGVSRRVGIAYALARRLATLGADVMAHSWAPHDDEMPWGADPVGAEGVAAKLTGELPAGAGRVVARSSDLADPAAPAALVDAATATFGGLDLLIATHARSSTYDLASSTAAELDLCWAVNVRATLLLAQRYAAVRDHSRPGGRMVMFTSGQYFAPMQGEIPYVTTKGALQQITKSLAMELSARRVTVNCIDPGPVNTGYAEPGGELYEFVASKMPFKRWGEPDDVANLVEWLARDEGGWMTGQTLSNDGGWQLGAFG
ncbi:SDR family oxidoreductase [Streptomyces sp. A7024]|uniref:SDR family oxidoreductase n=1 Tax=Streptomyces coryli TaxID=1128680 RepID=A0A6G4U5F4_9ACTN|nr:SDR family oxidoreductase [Streptomyces coryli]NGN67323.1 SDR family oxidoreductase [Streptomyces coryli]